MFQRPALSLARLFTLLILLSSGLAGNQAQAADYPARTIKIIVPHVAGGSDDVLGRIFAKILAEKWGQAVVVENHPGAGGTIAMGLLAKSAPDGYTIGVADSGQLAIAPNINTKLSYDTLRDLTPIVNVVSSQRVLAVRPGLPVKTVRELIDLAKSKPGSMSYGSTGVGGSAYLNMELFKSIAGVNILQVPYKGTAACVNDLLAGQIDMTIGHILSVATLAKEGKVRLLATSSSKRSPLAPELPTMSEAGLEGYSADIWVGFVAPAGTPRSIVEKLNSAIVGAVNTHEMRQLFLKLGYTAIGDTPEQFAETIKADTERFGRVIKSANITSQ